MNKQPTLQNYRFGCVRSCMLVRFESMILHDAPWIFIAGEPIKSSKTFLLIIKLIQLKLFKLDFNHNLWSLKIILNN